MTDIRTKLIPALKGLIAFFLLTVIFVIAINFLSYSKRQPEVAQVEKSDIPESKEKKEKIEFTETDGEKESLRGMADEYFEGEDGLIHARGNVWLRRLEKYELEAGEIIYDREQTHFLLEGKAKIRFEDAILEGSVIEYDRMENVFWTERQAVFTSERLNGSAGKIRYNLDSQEIELGDGLRLRFTPRLDTAFPLLVEGDSLTYSRQSKKGSIEGPVKFFHDRSWGSADSAGFELYANEEHVRFINLEGHVEGILVEENRLGIERRFQADKVLLQTFVDFFKVHAFEATGHCRFQFISPSGDTREGESDFLKFVLSRTGELREFHAIGQAKLLDEDVNEDDQRVIEGESLVIVEAVKGLQIKGSEEMKGRLKSGIFEISAGDILLDTDNNNLNAAGGVKVIINPNQEERSMGFFSQEKSVFVSSDEMRYNDRLKRYTFRGRTKSWQEKDMLMAEELTIDKETGKIYGEGPVIAVFPYTSKSSSEEVRVEVGGQKMAIDPDNKTIVFQDRCSLRARDVDLRSASIWIDMEEEGEGMQKMLAEGDVVISQQQFEAKGKRAQFDMEKETIVLMGNAVFVDKNKGRIECDKLTFCLADDRIIVENQGQERSFSVIKS
jgi:lipopolysaccharide transport protein LptA